MSRPLDERLRQVKAELAKIESILTTHSGTKVTLEVADEFKKVTAFANEVDHCLRMIEARRIAWNVLVGLEGLADGDDTVPVGAGRAKFHYVRFLGLQAYLASKWALADNIAAVAGQVLCAPNQLTDMEKRPPQLVSHFIGNELEKKTAALAFLSLRRMFGWPIGVSYAVRNQFVHDGGRNKGDFNRGDFFDGDAAVSAFAISEEGWKSVETRAKSYGVEPTHHRLGAGWPVTPRADLRVVLEVCEREMDDALGVLVGSATRTLASHVAYMVGEL
jgi:hypothetical protein